MFALLCYEMVNKFISDQTLIRLSKWQCKVSEIPFPAITFCPDMIIAGHNISPALELHEMLGFLPSKKKLEMYTEYHHQKYYEDFNFSAESLLPELRRRTQLDWFTNCVSLEWLGQYSTSVSLVLTRFGFCFSFNMRPIETLLRFDK